MSWSKSTSTSSRSKPCRTLLVRRTARPRLAWGLGTWNHQPRSVDVAPGIDSTALTGTCTPCLRCTCHGLGTAPTRQRPTRTLGTRRSCSPTHRPFWSTQGICQLHTMRPLSSAEAADKSTRLLSGAWPHDRATRAQYQHCYLYARQASRVPAEQGSMCTRHQTPAMQLTARRLSSKTSTQAWQFANCLHTC